MNKNIDFLNILRSIAKHPEQSQRILAKNIGLSLGKLNYCLKALRHKGWIKIKNFTKSEKKLNYMYLVTPKGISYKTKMAYFFMKQKIKEYEDLKKEIKK